MRVGAYRAPDKAKPDAENRLILPSSRILSHYPALSAPLAGITHVDAWLVLNFSTSPTVFRTYLYDPSENVYEARLHLSLILSLNTV
jgi:hypothetical protein